MSEKHPAQTYRQPSTRLPRTAAREPEFCVAFSCGTLVSGLRGEGAAALDGLPRRAGYTSGTARRLNPGLYYSGQLLWRSRRRRGGPAMRMRSAIARIVPEETICDPVHAISANSAGTVSDSNVATAESVALRLFTVSPGRGRRPAGPYDIVIEGNLISGMIAFDPVTADRRGRTERPNGDCVVEATGVCVMQHLWPAHAAEC